MERQTPVHSDLVTSSGSHRRSGFTLVEVLVVIMIIALLAGLLTPAVMKSMSSSRAAAVKAEIELLNTALMNYKNEYGSFPPSDMRGLWNGSSANTTHPVYKHLQRIFPRINEPTTGGAASPYFWMAQMSPAQAMVFWLQGFFDDPQYPLTNGSTLTASMPRAGTSTANRKKLFDFDESRLYAAMGGVVTPAGNTGGYWNISGSPIAPPSPQSFDTRNNASTAFARDYPVYFPNQASAGLPYVYFSSGGYSTPPTGSVSFSIGPGLSPDLYYTAISRNGNNSAIAPYFDSANCSILVAMTPQFSWAQLHMNPDTFQLIAAGADGTYGGAVAGFPADAAFLINSTSHGTFTSVKNALGHEDNITNFANGRLKEAAERLSQ